MSGEAVVDGDHRTTAPGGWRRGLRLVGHIAQQVFVAPIRAGRLRDNGWPPGLRAIVVIGLLLYAVLMGLAVLGGRIRSVADLIYMDPNQTFPAPALPVVVVAIVFAASCLYTAGLHLVWWLRPVALLVVLAIVLRPLDLSDPHWTNLVFLASAAVLVVMMAVRWGKAFRWWEFVAAVAVIGHAVVANLVFLADRYAGFANDLRLSNLALVMLVMWILAIPAAMVAGAAMAELTTSAVSWTVASLVGAVGRRSVTVCLVLVGLGCLWRFGYSGWLLATDEGQDPLTFVVGVVLAAVLVALCFGVAAIPPRAGIRPGAMAADGSLLTWSRATLPMALLLSASLVGTLLVSEVLKTMGFPAAGDWLLNLGGGNQVWVLTLLLGSGCLVWAFRLARLGRREGAVVWGAFGGLLVVARVNAILGLEASVAGMLTVTSVLALVTAGWQVARGRRDTGGLVGLAMIAVLGTVYEFREYIFEPLTAVFALTGVGAGLLVGLLWRLLTDNGYSHGHSARFPRGSRVLLALANATFGVTALAMVSLLGGYWELDLALAESGGDTLLGGTLLIVVVSACLRDSLRRDAPDAG